nr:MAG: ORF1 [TTV-like mini virus]UGV38111.1 MAG: ORF1 [TTV-like mini virus]
MPWLWRSRRWRHPWRRRRYYPRRRLYRRWRTRRSLRRRKRYYTTVRKRRFKRKLKKLILKQWQPKTIHSCHIKGIMPLIVCAPGRESFNYAQYMNSLTPRLWPGGGGWSIMQFTLASLWEQRELDRNLWTKSNVALPLFRFCGAKCTFYRQQKVDYIVHWRTCYPMTDTDQEHIMAQPSNAYLLRHRLVVPSKQTQPKGKNYIKKRIPMPSELLNKWFFQRDLCNTPYFLLTTTACNLDRWFLNPFSYSDSITLYSLNTKNFTNRNFQFQGTEQYYYPRDGYYLYACPHAESPAQITKQGLIYLGQSMKYQAGQGSNNPTAQTIIDKNNMGNPWWHEYLNGDKVVFVSNKKPTEVMTDQFESKKAEWFTIQTIPTLVECRYTPSRDTGLGNRAWFKKNTRQEKDWDPPEDKNLIIEGYPLWMLLWGWYDWQKKLKIMQQIEYNYILVIVSDFFDEKLPGYVFLDKTFKQGADPYYRGDEEAQYLSQSNINHYYPKFLWQQESTNTICTTGPGVVKLKSESIEVKMKYDFYFKWGGCPSKIENITDPCSQPKYVVPNNGLQTVQIQNPATDPKTMLYEWDTRRDFLTPKAAKRLRKDSETETLCISPTGESLSCPPIQQKTSYQQILQEIQDSTSESEEEETPLQERIQHQQRQHRKLRQHIKQLLLRLQQLE